MEDNSEELILHEISELRKLYKNSLQENRKTLAANNDEIKSHLNQLSKSSKAEGVLLKRLDNLENTISDLDVHVARRCMEGFRGLRLRTSNPELSEALALLRRLQRNSFGIPLKWWIILQISSFIVIIFLTLAYFRENRKSDYIELHRDRLINFVFSNERVEQELYGQYPGLKNDDGTRPEILRYDHVENKYRWYKGWFGKPE